MRVKPDRNSGVSIPSPPATYSLEPESASAATVPSGAGFQPVAAPVPASSAARLLRACPPTDVNEPPTYSVVPVAARAFTGPLGTGFQAVAAPVAPFRAARPARAWPPIV